MTNRKLTLVFAVILSLIVSSGCVYRATIAQGNLVQEEDLEQVDVGMTRKQVRFLLGTPMIDDPFNRDRWDYIYYLKIGRGDTRFKRWVSVFFENDIVSEVRRDQELDPGL